MKTLATIVLSLATIEACGQELIQRTALADVSSFVERVDSQRISKSVHALAEFGTRHTLSETRSDERGIGAARRWIHEQLQEIEGADEARWRVSFGRHTVPPGRRITTETEVVNVIGRLAGRDEGRYLIVSGHYDSRATDALDAESDAPGANDDASGVAVMMEAARVLHDLDPRCTILFIAFAGEEQGLLGSKAHARLARSRGRRIEAMITNDIVGGVRGSSGKQEPMRIRLFSEGVPSGPKAPNGRVLKGIVGSDNDASSRQLARYLARRAPLYVPGFEVTLIFRQDRFLRGGDHRPFNTFGFPGVRFTECHENYDWQHQDVREEGNRAFGDRPENVDFDYVARVARVNVAGIAELALAPPSPRGVRIMVDRLTPHTELQWKKLEAEDLAGYTIVMRRTHEPTWTHEIHVDDPAATSLTVEGHSKDDWLFGVQSRDRAGHRSRPVYPTPSYHRRR